MIIAAHIFAANAASSVLYQCLLQLSIDHPSDGFIFLAEKKWPEFDSLPSNINIVYISPTPKNGLLLHYWYSFKLQSLLKKNKATHFISESGACSIKSGIPQYLLINNISFLQKKPLFAQAHSAYLKRFFPKFLQSVTSLLVVENFIAGHIVQKYPAAKARLAYIGHGLCEAYQPVDAEQKEKMLAAFTGGTEYFISECTVTSKSNLLILLRAFSLFKKRQKSAMQLMLLMNGININDCITDFRLYKYRDDVLIISGQDEKDTARRLACAYASIYLPQQVIAENTGLNALQSGIPLITVENADAVSIYGEAALYSPLTEKAIAENMMLLYKDELLRNDHIQKGKQISSRYTWPSTSAAIWELISAS